jgi:hypothetical protein
MIQRIVIPDLTGGVSRQPDNQRFPNQVEEATNTFLHLGKGIEKRAGSEFVFDINNIGSGDIKIHWIERSSTERYIMMIHNDATTPLHIRTIGGTACTITYISAAAQKAYLATSTANLRMVTVDDTTIVVNTDTTVTLNTTVTPRLYLSTEVDTANNAHNKASWEDFDLPPTVAGGANWYAQGDALGHPAGWYQAISTGYQPWYQRVQTPMANSAILDTTAPLRIVQTGPTAFTVSWCPWIPRYSGDSATNPGPSFIGKKITDVCVHRNRLWFSAGEHVVGSASGDFFNFWLDSYSTIIDSDPIDIKLSSSQVTSITWMMPFRRCIVVFTASNQQYEIRAEEALSPTTVTVIPSTTYTSPSVKPVVIGSQLYWTANKGPWSQMYEYITDEATAQSVVLDTTSHVDGFIPSGLAELKASSANDVLFARSNSNDIYVNFMFWQGEKKIQMSWAKWNLSDSHSLLGFNVIDDHLYMISRIISGASINRFRVEKMPLRHSDALPSYTPRLDCRFNVFGTSFNPATKKTYFTIPFCAPDLAEAFLGSAWGNQEGVRFDTEFQTLAASYTQVCLNGNYMSAAVTFGRPFDMEIQLSKQYLRDQQQVAAVGSLQLKQCSVHHRNTGFFDFVIDPRTSPASDRVYTYTGKALGSIGFILNQNILSDKDSQNFKVMGSAGAVDLYIRSDSCAPVNITGLEFSVDFVPSKRSAAST